MVRHFLILCLFCNNLNTTEKPYVTCHLHGQLGNQLFEIAAALAYAWDHNVEPIFPELNRPDLNIPLNKKKIFFRLKRTPLPRPPIATHTFYRRQFEYEEIPFQPDLKLDGYFFNYQFFDHHRKKICKTFAPSRRELKIIQETHAELLQHPFTVGVHVRTYNQECNDRGLPFLGLDYYKEAMSFFPPETLFVIFSDRINWCKHHFQKLNRSMVFIEDQGYIRDLFLMSMLKHNIICNSTFSWWAAYLNQNPNKIVITPSRHIRPRKETTVVSCTMPDWISLECPCTYHFVPYPDDIYTFDNQSTSIDTQ